MNVQDVKTHLSSLLDRVVGGETIIVSRHNKPIAELRPLPKELPMRTAGLLKGQITWTDDAFKPLTDSELADFDQSSLFPVASSAQTNGQ
jgi:antitoxin (DNA-binding transcriptional repressor) of toxin-antitoxin stability system